MQIELNIPPNKQRIFLDYFNAALRSKFRGYSGSANFLEDGSFESSVTGEFPIGEKSEVLFWKIHKTKDGTLKYIDVKCPALEKEENFWESFVNEFITSVWSAAFSEKCQRFFQRRFFYYIGQQLDGEYWLPGFRFAPVFPEDSEPYLINAERVVSIDMNIEAIDEKHACSIADERGKRYAARLSLLLNIGLYSNLNELRWVLIRNDESSTNDSQRCQLGFFKNIEPVDKMPKKEELCGLGKYENSLDLRYIEAGKPLNLPRESRKILRGIEKNPIITDSFDRCARLYQVALIVGKRFPSVSLAYKIAAVEALTKPQHLSGYKGFSDFVRKNVEERSGLNEILDFLHGSVRSAHFHSGEFPMGEFSIMPFFDPILDVEMIERSNLQSLGYELIREAIITWLYKIVDRDKDK